MSVPTSREIREHRAYRDHLEATLPGLSGATACSDCAPTRGEMRRRADLCSTGRALWDEWRAAAERVSALSLRYDPPLVSLENALTAMRRAHEAFVAHTDRGWAPSSTEQSPPETLVAGAWLASEREPAGASR